MLKVVVANKCLNENTEAQEKQRLIYALVHLNRPTLLTNYFNSYLHLHLHVQNNFTSRLQYSILQYIDQFIEKLYSNSVVRRLIVVTFKSYEHNIVHL